MKFLLIALLALFALAAGGKPSHLGTLELVNQPQYGGEATLHVFLPKHKSRVNSVVWCYQTGAGAIYMKERWLVRYGKSLDMTFSIGPLQTSGDMYGPWNPAEPARCLAVVFQDIRPNGKGETKALTNWVSFVVPTEEGT